MNLDLDQSLITLEHLCTMWLKEYQIVGDLCVKNNIPLMIQKTSQKCYLQFHLCKMTEKMYHIMLDISYPTLYRICQIYHIQYNVRYNVRDIYIVYHMSDISDISYAT